jgi:hypothetical protein
VTQVIVPNAGTVTPAGVREPEYAVADEEIVTASKNDSVSKRVTNRVVGVPELVDHVHLPRIDEGMSRGTT